jgi:hypothetical protein
MIGQGGGAPTLRHEDRRRTLDALGILLGCTANLTAGLPDGSRPDVLRLSTTQRLLFLADAKDTETPGCKATAARLRRYLEWVRTHVTVMGGAAIVALAVGRPPERLRWLETLRNSASDVGLRPSTEGTDILDHTCALVWIAFGPGQNKAIDG